MEISHDGKLLQMTVDTGSNDTMIKSSFRSALTGDEMRDLRNISEIRGGASGEVRQKIQMLPRLRLDLLDHRVNLKKIRLPPDGPGLSRDDGIIGMDALWGGFRIDFETMRLELE